MRGSVTPVIPMGDTIWFEYNPPEFESSKDVNWAEIGIPGLNFPLQQFVRGGLRSLSLEVYFNADYYDHVFDVQDSVDRLEALVEKSEETMAPPVCLFSWGRFQVPCVVGSVSTRYSMFDGDGTPLEATVGLSLRYYMEAGPELAPGGFMPEEIAKRRPVYSGRHGSGSAFAPEEEGGLKEAEKMAGEGNTKSHVVKDGDSVQSVSTKQYGSPRHWRAVDFANSFKKGYTKARELKRGIELRIPDRRFPLSSLQRITGFSRGTMDSLRIAQKIHVEGPERHFKPKGL